MNINDLDSLPAISSITLTRAANNKSMASVYFQRGQVITPVHCWGATMQEALDKALAQRPVEVSYQQEAKPSSDLADLLS